MNDIVDIRDIDFVVESDDTDIDFVVESDDIDIDFEVDDVITIGGCCDYNELTNKPKINHKTIEAGNNTYDYLGIQEKINNITEQDIDNIIYGG